MLQGQPDSVCGQTGVLSTEDYNKCGDRKTHIDYDKGRHPGAESWSSRAGFYEGSETEMTEENSFLNQNYILNVALKQ